MNVELLNACAKFIENISDNLNYITPSELREILHDSPQSVCVLDVRNAEAYAESHIEGSVNIFIDDLFHEKTLEKIPTDQQIVVCCGIGHIASQILMLLQLLGFDAICLKYGMGVSTVAGEIQKGWVELGYPVKSSAQSR